MTCRPRPRMPTVADSFNREWTGLRAPEPEKEKTELGTIFVGGLLVAAAVAGVIEYRKHYYR
jgi:hypothetical protein